VTSTERFYTVVLLVALSSQSLQVSSALYAEETSVCSRRANDLLGSFASVFPLYFVPATAQQPLKLYNGYDTVQHCRGPEENKINKKDEVMLLYAGGGGSMR
jgi:hypothetical protein